MLWDWGGFEGRGVGTQCPPKNAAMNTLPILCWPGTRRGNRARAQKRAHEVSALRVSGLASDAAIATDAIRATEAHDTSHAT